VGVTVIIANYNQLSTLPVSLRSMAMQEQLPQQVVVADDGSCDGSVEWLDQLPDDAYPFPLFYVTHSHFGYGLAVIENLAAKSVNSGRLLFTNADVVHGPTSVLAHRMMYDVEVAGGHVEDVAMPWSQMVRPADMNYFASFVRYFGCFKGDYSNAEFMRRDPFINIYGIWGGNFSVSVALFHEVGGFNEDYRCLYGGEEADLIQRLIKVGARPAWAYNSTAYHLAHPKRAYASVPRGNLKYRLEYLVL
jgi:GT2 family glycosyltransferase